MAHFAKVENGVVVEVIVAEQEFIDTLPNPSSWIQTSYNTYQGTHLNGGTPLRMNYASVGGTYDAERDAFIPPKPHKSHIFDEAVCDWFPPTQKPEFNSATHKCIWDENQYDSTGDGWVLIPHPVLP